MLLQLPIIHGQKNRSIARNTKLKRNNGTKLNNFLLDSDMNCETMINPNARNNIEYISMLLCTQISMSVCKNSKEKTELTKKGNKENTISSTTSNES